MITPPSLKPGDKIGIVAPARKLEKTMILEQLKTLTDWGFELVLSPHLFNEEHQYSGKDEQRRSDLQQMLDDADIKAIVCARGGYGTLRIIDQLDFTEFAKSPKWVVGYSDVTVLHSFIHEQVGVETLHATMPVNFALDTESTESLRMVLTGQPKSYQWKAHSLNKNGNSKGILVGGNLSILYAMQGSNADLDTAGKILFLEDVDEYLYHIDRMMISMKRSGKLSKLSGLLIGGMTDMKDNEVPFGKTAEEIILDAVKEYDYPVAFGFAAGHGQKNSAFPLGRKAELRVGDNAEIYF